MKLNIVNYNPTYQNDIAYIDTLINMFNNIKQHINDKQYEAYQEFLMRVNNFMNMMTPNLQKDITRRSQPNIFEIDDDNNQDDISIASISDYELDNDEQEQEIKDMEIMMIKNFEEKSKQALNKNKMRYSFDFTKC